MLLKSIISGQSSLIGLQSWLPEQWTTQICIRQLSAHVSSCFLLYVYLYHHCFYQFIMPEIMRKWCHFFFLSFKRDFFNSTTLWVQSMCLGMCHRNRWQCFRAFRSSCLKIQGCRKRPPLCVGSFNSTTQQETVQGVIHLQN